MNRNELRHVDLSLLIIFETVMIERNLSRAAEKLYLGQPAISAALVRLRAFFDDPLFIRAGRMMRPTAIALEAYQRLVPVLDSMSSALGDSINLARVSKAHAPSRPF
jgi:LysR family transcriptional regulator, mexEF-oprN operon transcriptional activator